MKKKISFMTPQLKTGGGNRVFIELSNKLVEQGYDVEIIYPNNSKSKNTFFISDKISMICIGELKNSKIGKLVNLIKALLWVRKKRKENKIIISDPIMSIFSFLIKNRNIYRFIQADDYTIFDDGFLIKNRIILFVYKILTKKSYKYKKIKYIFNSKFVYEKFIRNGGIKDTKFRLVHPGVDEKIFNSKTKIVADKINLGIVARIHPIKGFKDFLQAYGKINYQVKDKINKIYIITHDNLDEFNLKNKKFEIINPKDDYEIAAILRKTSIFISPSWIEGFGLPQLEAMFCGNLLLTSNSGGVLEYALDNNNCLMYEAKNIQELKEKLEILICDEKIQSKLKLNTYESIKNFSWENTAEMFKKAIED